MLDWQTCQVLQDIYIYIHNIELSTGKKHDLEGLAAQEKWPWRLLDIFAVVMRLFARKEFTQHRISIPQATCKTLT